MAAALEARGLTMRFGANVALDRLDLAVAPGEIVCLLGANGAGKTTALNLFLGFLTPCAGEALVLGVRPDLDPVGARRRAAYLPEAVALNAPLSGVENLDLFRALSGLPELSSGELTELLVRAGIPREACQRRTDTYSKGMRQKVALAAAIARGAEAWLLDEPLSGLDPHAANELGVSLRSAAASGAAVLMATHDLFRARDLATRVGILRSGRLMELLDPTKISAGDLERIYLQHMASSAG
jgi:ABC-2 type transport system ATP-binding protein